jgi:hypothetical protein
VSAPTAPTPTDHHHLRRHGFDTFRLHGATWQATVGALAALAAHDLDPAALSAHIATITTLVDTWRTFELLMYVTSYDAVLGRLLIAVGQPEQARHRLDTGLALARDTGMCFYDAELLRLRAHTHTHTDPAGRQADVGAALELALRQGATLFELRAALDDYGATRPGSAHRRGPPHPRRQFVAGTGACPGRNESNRPAIWVVRGSPASGMATTG